MPGSVCLACCQNHQDLSLDHVLQSLSDFLGCDYCQCYWASDTHEFIPIYKENGNSEGEHVLDQFPTQAVLEPIWYARHNKNFLILPLNRSQDDLVGVLVCAYAEENERGTIPDFCPVCMQLVALLTKEYVLMTQNNLEHELKSKDLLLANISHEIRTPLNGIIGYNQLLMQSNLVGVQHYYVERMNACSVQLMKCVNDVIDFSKLTTGNMTLVTESFTVQEVVDNIKSTLGSKLFHKQQNITFCIEPRLGAQFIKLDKQKLIYILVNLVANAITYTKSEGTINIIFYFRTVERTQKHFLCIDVSDNGVGIDVADQERLFEPFVQLHNGQNKNSGSGLGLAIVKRLVLLMKGSIELKSQLNLGSTFSCRLPCFLDNNHCEAAPIVDLSPLLNKEILIVDSQFESRMTMTSLLLEWKMKAFSCASAQEALCYISSTTFNIEMVVIDLGHDCKIFNGVELARSIKCLRQDIPLIAVAVSDYHDMVDFSATVSKPVHTQRLQRCLVNIANEELSKSAFIGSEKQNELTLSTHVIAESTKRKLRILIAEDYEDNTVVLQHLLSSLGYQSVDTAEDGAEAIALIEKMSLQHQKSYEILLLDLRMPKVDGFQVIQYMVDNNYKLPITIAVTACVSERDKELCQSLGVEYFITKPIQVNQLREVLHHIVTKKLTL